jgi:lipopolysaccharide/colanic/teichoic acid biosynthesis glycosyltransferase
MLCIAIIKEGNMDKKIVEFNEKKYKYDLFYAKFVKRGFDICLSIAIMPIVVLVGIPIAVLIKLEDGGDVFFCGERYGKNMRKFRMVKFRSMKMNAEDIRNSDGTTYNSDKDNRQTRIGRLLRKTSLDELGQIINVLIGDMSFVGPRPSPMGNEKSYTKFIKQKFNVRPGITGLNQALLRNSATLDERYKNDVYYVKHVCLALDVDIIKLTIKSVLGKKNIYNS